MELRKEKDDTNYAVLAKRMQDVQGYWSKQYENIEADMRFATGDQWSALGRKEREARGFPVITKDFTKNYIDRIVNPITKYPFGMNVKHQDTKINELYQGLIRDIEYRSNAAEAYETAFRTAVQGGVGFTIVTTDYADNETLNQTISIERVVDPTAVWIDPTSEKVDGSDMEYAMYVKYVDKDRANEQYDIDSVESAQITNFAELYRGWIIPENTVPEMLYWTKKRKNVKRTWLKDGSYIDGKPEQEIPEEMIAGTRDIETKWVEISKYIGGKLVSTSELETEYIPVVPCYGDTVYQSGWKGYAGIVHLVRDTQSTINYYASAEVQRIQSAPINQWVMAEGQDEGYEDEWATANTEAYDSLKYKPVSLGGVPVAPPTRQDNQAQTQDLIQSRMSSVDDMQRTTGIFDSQLGNEEGGQQSGKAILLKQNNANISSFHYTDNLMKMIKQVGRITLQLINSIYDTERQLNVRGEDGSIVQINGNIKESGKPSNEFDTEVEAGPMVQNERETSTAILLEIGKMAPEKFGLYVDKIVENIQAPNSDDIVERLRKSLPPELLAGENGESQPDPQAIQALQMAEQNAAQQAQIIEQYEAMITDLRTQVIDNESDRKAKIQSEQIQAQVTRYKTDQDNATKLELKRMDLEGQATSDQRKFATEQAKEMDDVVNTMLTEVDASIESVPDVLPEEMQPEEVQPEEEAVESIDDLLG